MKATWAMRSVLIQIGNVCSYEYRGGAPSLRSGRVGNERSRRTGGRAAARRSSVWAMAKHVVGRTDAVPPGGRTVVTVRGRRIVIFNLGGEFYALLDRCPHQAAELSAGIAAGIATADEPGAVQCSRAGEFIRCPWHGWEFDIRTGQSWCEPERINVRQYAVSVEPGANLVKGPYVAEKVPVSVEDAYLVVEV